MMRLTVEPNEIVSANSSNFRLSSDDARRIRKVVFDFLCLYNATAHYYMEAATARKLLISRSNSII